MLKHNNILSYFIKDIKDSKESALYTQTNNNNYSVIYYKDKKLYKTMFTKLCPKICWNYKNNVIIEYFSGNIINYKIDSNKRLKYKALFYKKDKIISKINDNYILYEFIYNKYLIKNFFDYVIDDKDLLCINIQYYNGYKYLYKDKNNYKYKYVQILIMNKYELHYINRFFNLFFVSKNY
jgi:hypothetical protein